MLSIQLPNELENKLKKVVLENYQGDLQAAIQSFLYLHTKYGWKEQLQEDVQSIRHEIKRSGGIPAKKIDEVIKSIRRRSGSSHE